MSVNSSSKHFNSYYSHVLNKKKVKGTLAIVYNLIEDISDRRGLRQEWEQIDGEIQDEIINKWIEIIDKK